MSRTNQNGRPAVLQKTSEPAGFFSKQVSRAQYYYQTLTPTSRDPLVVICGGMEVCRPDYALRRSDFRYWSIEFVAAGHGELVLGNTRHALSPGTVFCYGPSCYHEIATDAKAPMTKHFVDFAGTEAPDLLASTIFGTAPVQLRNAVHVVEVLSELERTANRDTHESKEICSLLLRILCRRVAEEALPASAAQSRALHTYQRCLALIDSDFMQLHNLKEISTACHASPEYLCRLFKRFGETTPNTYLTRLRMKYAANRLQDPSTLVLQIARELDYSDPFHFSRAFKRIHGLSPQQFRSVAVRGANPVAGDG